MVQTSDGFLERLSRSPEAVKSAAVSRWTEETRMDRSSLERRLEMSVQSGIITETLDLIDALEIPEAEAKNFIATVYKQGAKSSNYLAGFWKRQGKPELEKSYRENAAADIEHSILIESGSISVSEELDARKKQREELGFKENYYKHLEQKPILK